MPHIILEHSSNINSKPKPAKILHELNQILVSTGHFNIQGIKSRMIERKDYFVADNSKNVFVHLELSILEGRSVAIRKEVSALLIKYLEKEFSETIKEQSCALSVEVREINKESYSKVDSL